MELSKKAGQYGGTHDIHISWWNQATHSLESDFNYFYSHKLISLNLLLVVLLFKCSITYKSYGSMEFKRYC